MLHYAGSSNWLKWQTWEELSQLRSVRGRKHCRLLETWQKRFHTIHKPGRQSNKKNQHPHFYMLPFFVDIIKGDSRTHGKTNSYMDIHSEEIKIFYPNKNMTLKTFKSLILSVPLKAGCNFNISRKSNAMSCFPSHLTLPVRWWLTCLLIYGHYMSCFLSVIASEW